jgi:hypothetical protein
MAPVQAGQPWPYSIDNTPARTLSRLRARGLAPTRIGGRWYVLPDEPFVQELARQLQAGDHTVAGPLADYLGDRGVPRPGPLLEILDGREPSRPQRLTTRPERPPHMNARTRRRLRGKRPIPPNPLPAMGGNAAKRRMVRAWLLTDQNAQWSNRVLARQCGVSEGLVRSVRAELNPDALTAHGAQMGGRRVVRGGSVYLMRTTRTEVPQPPEADPEAPN